MDGATGTTDINEQQLLNKGNDTLKFMDELLAA